MSGAPFILVLNSGSSSLKFSAYARANLQPLLNGAASQLNTPNAELTFAAQPTSIAIPDANHQQALVEILKRLPASGLATEHLAAVGHRVVHGGEKFHQSVLINDQALTAIRACCELAPLHNPANLMGIEAIAQLCPSVPQIAVFDTAFHQTLPAKAYLYGVPFHLYQEFGVRRYGFHGTSHRYVAQRAVDQLALAALDHQLLIAHLGNGCSATAVVNGESVDTTMGLTPLEGTLMGTRSGDVDPGLHQYLQHKLGWDLGQITDMLNKKSGLLGLSSISNDMRQIASAAESGNEQARLAIDVFCFRLARLLGGLATSLKRIDALVFTGGIGQHSALVRSKVLEQLAILGFDEDPLRNQQHGQHDNGLITRVQSRRALVIATDEERMIAMDCAHLIEDL